MKDLLVKTGKYRQELVKKLSVKPDYEIESISKLDKFIRQLALNRARAYIVTELSLVFR